MNKLRIVVIAVILAVIAALIGVVTMTSANAQGEGEPCVPSEAWTETIEHPAVTHVVHHEAVTHVVHHDAVTHEEKVVDSPAIPEVWANFQPDDSQATFVGPALWPTDARGSWTVHNQLPPGHEGPDGVYSKGNPAKGGNWFYRHALVPEVSHMITVVDQEAYDEVVVDQEAYDETVIDEEAWTETIEHPEVTCEGEQPDPLVQVTSSTSYECDDDFQTTVTVTTTTEYVLVEGEWVLGEPVSETVTETAPHAVVPCETEEPPNEEPPSEEPPVKNPPVKHNNTPAAVPTVINAGL